MKKTFVILFLSALCSCSKDELPPESQIGANTIGCLINGSVFLPHAGGSNPTITATYEYFDGGYFFNLGLTDNRRNSIKSVLISLRKTEIHLGVIPLNKHYLNDQNYIGGSGSYFVNAIELYSTDQVFTGEINFTRVDLSASIVSGTFWFTAANPNGEIISVQAGRFDVHL